MPICCWVGMPVCQHDSDNTLQVNTMRDFFLGAAVYALISTVSGMMLLEASEPYPVSESARIAISQAYVDGSDEGYAEAMSECEGR